jgi:predicted TIM-barrel fold metal-dependent hydrolase
MIAPEKALDGIDDLQLDPDTCNRFLGANARAVFGL